jgi:GNAT superfamily N-acetyltransferase
MKPNQKAPAVLRGDGKPMSATQLERLLNGQSVSELLKTILNPYGPAEEAMTEQEQAAPEKPARKPTKKPAQEPVQEPVQEAVQEVVEETVSQAAAEVAPVEQTAPQEDPVVARMAEMEAALAQLRTEQAELQRQIASAPAEQAVEETAPIEIPEPELAVDFQAEPTAESTAELKKALAMSERSYLARVNPEGKTTEVPSDEVIDAELADTEPSSRATEVGKVGEDIRLMANGDYLYAVRGEDTVGLLVNKSEGSQLYVHSAERGRGLGRAMMRELLIRRPLAPTNGLSAAAQATRLSVLRELRNEQLPSLSQRFSSLVQSVTDVVGKSRAEVLAATNRFMSLYTVNAQSGGLFSRITGGTKQIVEAIDNETLVDMLPEDRKFLVNEFTNVEALREFFGPRVDEMIASMNKRLNVVMQSKMSEKSKKFAGRTRLEVFKSGEQTDMWNFADFAVLHAAVLNEDGTVSYHPEVAEAMALSVLRWTLDQHTRPVKPKMDQIVESWGGIENMPSEIYDAYQTGFALDKVSQTLANDLRRTLGLTMRNDVPVTMDGELMLGLAVNALDAAAARGRALAVMSAALICFLVWSGVCPYDRLTWFMEVLPVIVALPLMWATRRRFPLTDTLYACIFVHCCVLMLGGAYTYARVPMGFALQDWFGLDLGIEVAGEAFEDTHHGIAVGAQNLNPQLRRAGGNAGDITNALSG